MDTKRQQIQDILDHPEKLKYAYQPIFDLSDGSIYGYEALMRPEPFSPMDIVEYCLSEDRLDEIETITVIYGGLHFLGSHLEGRLFLNSFPAASVSREKMMEVRDIMKGRVRERMVFEMLEYTELDAYAWGRKLEEFARSRLDYLIAIDDYGTDDFEDSERMAMFHPDIVKVDRSLIENIHVDRTNQEKVKRILEYTQSNGIMALAEGVETKEEYDYIRSIPFRLVQGYYTGRPQIYNGF